MTLIKWKPRHLSINDFDQMINNIFNDGWNINSYKTNDLPAVDILEDKTKFELKADFPGFERKNISLSVEDGLLKLAAVQKNDADSNYTINERRSGNIERSFTLPDSVLPEKISAKYKNGTLLINIPKAKEIKPEVNKIKIN